MSSCWPDAGHAGPDVRLGNDGAARPHEGFQGGVGSPGGGQPWLDVGGRGGGAYGGDCPPRDHLSQDQELVTVHTTDAFS